MPDKSPPLEISENQTHRTATSLVIVNTGDGKGKSTAAFGTILRGLALGWKVAVVQFLKSDDWVVGEEKICRQLGVEWFTAGDGFTWDSTDIDETKAKAKAAWGFSKELIAKGEYRILVLDEISYPISWDWISEKEVASAIKSRPRDLNMILTGRDMSSEIVSAADTATEMRNIKHAFDSGIIAKKGIDY